MASQIKYFIKSRVFGTNAGWIVFSLHTTILSLAISTCLVALVYYFAGNAGIGKIPAEDSITLKLINSLIAAPLIENTISIILLNLIRSKLPEWASILFVATLSAFAHYFYIGMRAIPGFIQFSIMCYSYLLWNRLKPGMGFKVTLLQHFIFNTPSALLYIYFYAQDRFNP